jgi:hypothetical protein
MGRAVGDGVRVRTVVALSTSVLLIISGGRRARRTSAVATPRPTFA